MLSDEEKQQIIEKLAFEKEVRGSLQKTDNGTSPPGSFAWLESKLGLLLIGALLSGVLIPTFQCTQETFKWTRQNFYDNIKFQLSIIREGLKEFILIHALTRRTKIFKRIALP